MLDRVAVDESAMFVEEIDNLYKQIALYSKTDVRMSLDLLRSLYAKIPDELKYSGALYRGLRVAVEDIISLLENEPFHARDTSKMVVASSWTYNVDIAVRFIDGTMSSGSPFGLILYSDTSEQDVVMQFDSKVYEHLNEFAYRLDSNTERKWKELKSFVQLAEISVVNTGESAYNLCQDVGMLVVNAKALKSPFEPWSTVYTLLKERLDEESLQDVEQDVKSYNYSRFECDGQGRLKYVK